MFTFLLRVFLLFFSIQLFAEEEIENPSVAATEGLPSNFVNNSVCVITGEYVDNTLDITIPGPEPLTLSRKYSSLTPVDYFGVGWFINQHDVATYKYAVKNYLKVYCITLGQTSGSRLCYTCPKSEDTSKEILLDFYYLKGIVNGGSTLSGRYNLKNQKVFYNDNKKVPVRVTTPDGSIRKYQKLDLKKYNYHQTEEEKLNKHRFLFSHDDQFRLTDITLKGPGDKVYSHINFEIKNNITKLTASNNKNITYQFKSLKSHVINDDKKEHLYLESVEASDATKISYQYLAGTTYPVLSRKTYRGQYVGIKYYNKGGNILTPIDLENIKKGGGNEPNKLESIHIDSQNDYRIGRVKQLTAPVGHDNSPIITHTFVYNAKTKDTQKGQEVLSGETEVYDAYLHKTLYAYNKDHRLKSVEKFSGTQPNFQSYKKDYYLWASDDSPQESNLLGKYIKDSQKRVLKAIYYEYDDRGNLTKERLCGKLTNIHAPELHLDHHHFPTGAYECDEKRYFYSGDGLNLLVREEGNSSEESSSQKSISYSYQHGTDIMTSKLIAIQDQIKMREFYEYDLDCVLVKKIIDDGSSIHKDDLTGMSERHVTYITPRSSAPFGLPECIEEKYLENGQEILLKKVVCEYSNEGYLTERKVYGSNGKHAYTERWEYNAHGKVTKEIDAMGHVVIKDYDENDNLKMVQGPHPDYEIRYNYDCANRLVQQIESYDGQQFVSSFRYDYLNNKTTASNYYGLETSYEYDEFGRVVKTTFPLLADEHGHLSQPCEMNRYNELDQIVAIIDAKGQTTSMEYNIRGKPFTITHPDGSKESFIYKINGSLRQKTEKNGSYTIYVRDYQDRVLKEEIYSPDHKLLKCSQFTYNAFHLMQSIAPDGLVTSYEYDGAGRLIAKTIGEHRTTQKYDNLGRLIEICEEGQRVHRKKYDLLDHVLDERITDSSGKKVLHVSQYTYDEQGNQISAKTGACGKTFTEYNPHRKPTKIIDAMGNATVIRYDHNFINGSGLRVLQITTIDPMGYQTIQTHDNIGRVVETVSKNPMGEKISSQQTFYDICGNKCRQIDAVIFDKKVTHSITTIWSYNYMNKLETLVEAASTPEQKTTRNEYNFYGQLASTIKPDGKKISYEYDALGRLTSSKSSDDSIHYSYTYNLSDLPVEISDGKNVTTREYDVYGQMTSERLGHGLTMQYEHDDLGHTTKVVLPDDSYIEYKHDILDLKEVHRWVNRERKYSHVNEKHNQTGQVCTARLPGQKENTKYSYDKLGRCVKMQNNHLNENVPQQGFDSVGNLLTYDSGDTNYQFSYDEYNQIKTEKGHTDHEYSCDSLSNRRKKDNLASSYNNLNQLLNQGNEKFKYDANGNLIQRTNGNEITTYTYDALDRLVAVSKDGRKIEYTYDSFNRRLTKKEKGKEEKLFLYQGIEEMGAWENGTMAELKILGDGRKRRIVAIELNQKPYVPIQDLLGHPTCLVDLQENMIEKYQYTAFGEENIVDANGQPITSKNPWRYAGKRTDEETGLIAFGRRFYDPTLGRWLTPDPIGYEDGPNLYAYLHHNPYMYFDAFGLWSDFLFGALGGGWNPAAFYSLSLGLVGKFSGITNTSPLESNTIDMTECQLPICTSPNARAQMQLCGLLMPCAYSASSTYDLNHDAIRNTDDPLRVNIKDKGAGYANGIMNDLPDFKETMNHLGNMIPGINMTGIHSTSYGFLPDAVQYYLAKDFYVCFDTVRLLHKQWDNFFQHSSSNAIFLQGCHSRGATYVRNALMSYPEEFRKRISVWAIAPASFIDKELCHSVRHYMSRDAIPYCDPAGMIRCWDTITILDAKGSFNDHSIMSKTYNKPIEDELTNYFGQRQR